MQRPKPLPPPAREASEPPSRMPKPPRGRAQKLAQRLLPKPK
jgi:hypothetical protein